MIGLRSQKKIFLIIEIENEYLNSKKHQTHHSRIITFEYFKGYKNVRCKHTSLSLLAPTVLEIDGKIQKFYVINRKGVLPVR